MLRVDNLEGFYGASQALFGMAFAVDAGEVVTLMGRNGMGKTTTVHAVMGLLTQRRGVVEFEGRRVDQLPVSYHRYLLNSMRRDLDLGPVPLRLTMRATKNPYDDKNS